MPSSPLFAVLLSVGEWVQAHPWFSWLSLVVVGGVLLSQGMMWFTRLLRRRGYRL